MVPCLHVGSFAHRYTEFAQNGGIQSLALHVDRHFVNAGQVFALDHALQVHIAEGGHFLTDTVGEVLFCAQDEHIGLDTSPLHLFYGVLGGLRFQLICGFQIGHIGEVDADGTVAQLPFQLADGLQKRS